MNKLRELKPKWAFAIYIILDILCIGMGMGVPIFCILLGFPVGLFIVMHITTVCNDVQTILKRSLLYSFVTAFVTLVGMLVIWVPFSTLLFDPGRDLAETGIPMILYDPLASFIGWLFLMILISPFLQFLTTLFGGHLALLTWLKKSVAE